MTPRRVGVALVAVTAILAMALAFRSPRGRLPTHTTVTVVTAPDDPRLPVVYQVVDHWNRTLAEIGSPLRLGPVTDVIGAVPDEDLIAISEKMLAGGGPSPLPSSVAGFPGDLVVVLSNAQFISFSTSGPRDTGRAMVAIKSHQQWPLTLPNVIENVVAHEVGHALGLGHNTDPTALMCGRPAPCRPDDFTSDTPRWFPLTAREGERLLAMYPPDDR